jgi:hypothetical protein
MNGNSSNQTTTKRWVAAWDDFFFRPRDPSTLGLMRIMAGIFVLYVHFAYTWDLYNFFGPNAFADLTLVDDIRKNYPVLSPDESWDQVRQNITVPADRLVREAFFDWAKTLPKEAGSRRESLDYLVSMQPPMMLEDINQCLGFAESAMIRTNDDSAVATRDQFRRTSSEERQSALDILTRGDVHDVSPDVLPTYFRNMKLSERENYRRSLVKLLDSMQHQEPAEIAMIFNHLIFQSTVPLAVHNPNEPLTEYQRTLRFLTEADDPSRRISDAGAGPYMPDDKQERADVLDYIKRWSVDPRLVYARGRYDWSIWFHVTNPTAMGVVHGIILISMAMFALGLFTRITSVMSWVGVLCYIHRCNYVLFGMDTMMNICMIYLVIGPSGATLSLDRWLEKRRAKRDLELAQRENRDTAEYEAILAGPRKSSLANFVTRMVQIHFCFIYAASGLSKLKGNAWWNHTAMWFTVVNPEFSPTVFRPYMWLMSHIVEHRWLVEIMMSIGAVYTLFLELGFPFLIWRPRLRPYMLIAAILLHTGIAVLMGLTVFGLFMMTLLMSYIPPETVKQWLELGERRLRRPTESKAVATEPAVAGV